MRKNKQGISLIILVVTIIIMIILAGVVVVSVGENNPIENAKVARFKTDYQQMKTELNDNVTRKLEKNTALKIEDIDARTLEELRVYIPSINKTFAKKVAIVDGELVLKKDKLDNVEKNISVEPEFKLDINSTAENPYIPVDFEKVSSAAGITVIKDKKRNNEFVWVPVNNIVDFERIMFKDNEGYTNLKNLDNNFKLVYDSVKKHGGFYVGRYETGVKQGELVVQKGVEVYNNVTGKKLQQKAMDMYYRSDIQSTMLHGTAFDAVVNWLIHTNPSLKGQIINGGTPSGNYSSGTAKKTGSSEAYKINEIYDLAGNFAEATLEYSENSKGDNLVYLVERGGSYNTPNSQSVAKRIDSQVNINGVTAAQGMRIMLFLK